jgi:hypothetical protein
MDLAVVKQPGRPDPSRVMAESVTNGNLPNSSDRLAYSSSTQNQSVG